MSDWIRKAITHKLRPQLEELGFYRCKPKHFVRVRGQLVENISFQVSGSGSKGFYVHYFTNLACSPNADSIISSYRIGRRIGHSQHDSIDWKGPFENMAFKAMDSVLNSIKKDIIPWFEERGTIQGYTIARAGHYATEYTDVEFLMCLLLCGELGKAYDMIKELAENNNDIDDSYEFRAIERLWEEMRHPCTDKLQLGIDLLELMKEENLKILRLDQSIT